MACAVLIAGLPALRTLRWTRIGMLGSAIEGQPSGDPQGKGPISGPNFRQARRRFAIETQPKRPGHGADVAHPSVDALQVAP